MLQSLYGRWLDHRADAHFKRDRKKREKIVGASVVTNEQYKIAIHSAVVECAGRDFYTGEDLDWGLIGTGDNEVSRALRRDYQSGRALMPVVDHVGDGLGAPEFKICSQRTNSAKHSLSHSQFVQLCRKVVDHNLGGASLREASTSSRAPVSVTET